MVKYSPKKKNKTVQTSENENCQCSVNEEVVENALQCNCQCSCIECPDEDPEIDIEVGEDPEIEVVVESEDPELYTDVIYGPPGRDGTINGFNQLTLQGGENVEVVTEGEGKVGTATIYVDMSGKVTHLSELTIEYAQEHLEEIVQYIGETTEDYIEGYFYQASEVSEESKLEYTYDEGGISDVEVNKETFENYVHPTEDLELTFIWSSEDNSWTLDGDLVDIALYGVSYTGDPIENNQLNITYEVEKTEIKWVQKNVQEATDISGKVDKVYEANRIYGTDENGDQTTYDKEDFGKVDDVRVKYAGDSDYETVVENKIAKIDMESGKVDYTFDATPNVQSVKDALDDLMNRQYYVEPSFSAFTFDKAGSYERQTTAITGTTFSWTLNKTPTSADRLEIRTGNNGGGDLICNIIANVESSKWKSGTWEYSEFSTLNTGKTYYIYYEDKHSTVPSGKSKVANRNASISFYIKKYYGATAIEEPTDAQIRALTNATSSKTLASTNFDFGSGKYWYYVLPIETYNKTDLVFAIGPAGSEALQSGNYFIYKKQDFKNAQGVEIPVYVYKFKKTPAGTPDKLTGSLNVKVS